MWNTVEQFLHLCVCICEIFACQVLLKFNSFSRTVKLYMVLCSYFQSSTVFCKLQSAISCLIESWSNVNRYTNYNRSEFCTCKRCTRGLRVFWKGPYRLLSVATKYGGYDDICLTKPWKLTSNFVSKSTHCGFFFFSSTFAWLPSLRFKSVLLSMQLLVQVSIQVEWCMVFSIWLSKSTLGLFENGNWYG